MAVYDRWHTKKPRLDDDGNPITCEHVSGGQPLYPSTAHGKGDRWQVRWRDADGKQCKRNFPRKTGKNPAVHAEAFDKQVQGDLISGTYLDPKAGEITLAEWAVKWRAGRTGKPSKLAVIDRRLAHIYDVPVPPGARRWKKNREHPSLIGGQAMAELAKRPQLVQEWVKDLEAKGLAPQYIHHIAQTLSGVFASAIENGIVARNPMNTSTVQLPPIPPRQVQPWTMKQVHVAAEQLSNAMPYLGAGAGLRSGEMFAVGPDLINRNQGVIHVRRQIITVDGALCFALPKRDKIRDAPLSDELLARLDAQIEARPPVAVTLPWDKPDGDPVTYELMFLQEDGTPWCRRPFDRTWNEVKAAVGVPKTRANGSHVLRHTFASACLEAGVDIRTLAAWLGHEDPGFTLRVYGHLMPSAAARGRRAIDRFFREES